MPEWLAGRMAKLGAIIAEAICSEYGRDEFLSRLANPFWFQCFGAVMGMDWHSTGITTSVIGALKRGLTPLEKELGLHVCGGRGKHSRKTPQELVEIGERVGFDGAALAQASRLVAKVDSAAVQDGFELYLHGFIVADDGKWVVVQQGMKDETCTARRYHWQSEGLRSFVEAPHAAIEGAGAGHDRQSHRRAGGPGARGDGRSAGHDRAGRHRARGRASSRAATVDAAPEESDEPMLPHLVMPAHHDVRPKDVMLRRLHASLGAAADKGPTDFAELLLVPGVGARTVRSLAMVAEVIHGAPHRFADPARYAMSKGGKDGAPFPVPLKVYDETIRVLKYAVVKARLGASEELSAIKRLDAQARAVEGKVDWTVVLWLRRRGMAAQQGIWRAHGDGRCARQGPAAAGMGQGRGLIGGAGCGGLRS